MDLTRYEQPTEFLAAAQPFLEADEERTGLIFGLALRLVDDPLQYGSTAPYFALVSDGGSPVLAALMTPPFSVLVHGGVEGVPLVVGDLLGDRWSVAGVMGPVELAAESAHAWRVATGQRSEVAHHERAFVLREVTPPEGVPGAARAADEGDLAAVAAWQRGFALEALDGEDPTDVEATAKRAIAERSCWLWEDGSPVSMVQQTRRTTHGATVSYVYTPPEHRGRGYASAAVAGLSQHLLEGGFEFCTLFTDLANPTSNHIYQQIGYRPVGDFDQLRFIP